MHSHTVGNFRIAGGHVIFVVAIRVFDAFSRADFKYHLGFKNKDLRAKTTVFGRLVAPAMLTGAK